MASPVRTYRLLPLLILLLLPLLPHCFQLIDNPPIISDLIPPSKHLPQHCPPFPPAPQPQISQQQIIIWQRVHEEVCALPLLAQLNLTDLLVLELFFTEPILILITLYQSFIFGLLYLFSQSYSIAVEEVRQWRHNLGSLPLLALIIGVAAGLFISIVHTKTHFARIAAANGGAIVPEHRLPVMIFGSCVLPIGLFWFAWTSDSSIPWLSMVTAGILIGCGLFIIFVQCFGYIIEVYSSMANSVLAANNLFAKFVGRWFPAVRARHVSSFGDRMGE